MAYLRLVRHICAWGLSQIHHEKPDRIRPCADRVSSDVRRIVGAGPQRGQDGVRRDHAVRLGIVCNRGGELVRGRLRAAHKEQGTGGGASFEAADANRCFSRTAGVARFDARCSSPRGTDALRDKRGESGRSARRVALQKVRPVAEGMGYRLALGGGDPGP